MAMTVDERVKHQIGELVITVIQQTAKIEELQAKVAELTPPEQPKDSDQAHNRQ